MFGSPTPTPMPTSQYVQQQKETLERAYQHAREKMKLTLQRQKDLYDHHIHGQPYTVGDLVWLHCPAVARGHSKKLHRPWRGPFQVLRAIGNTTYHIKDMKTPRRKFWVHFNRLKPYVSCDQQIPMAPQAYPMLEASTDPQQPVGAQLTLLEPEGERHEFGPPGEVSLPPLHSQPAAEQPQTTRYSQRNRRCPNY